MKIEKQITKYIQGIAITLMVFHHLIGFPENIMDGVELRTIILGGHTIDVEIARMSKLCVSLFAVVTGYGFAQRDRVTFHYLLHKVKYLLVAYWISEAIFIALYAISGLPLKIKNIIMNTILLESDINYSTWYMLFYIMACITIWLIDRLFRNHVKWLWCVILIFWGINYLLCIIGNIDIRIFHYFHYMPTVLVAYYLGKTGVFDKVYSFGVKSSYSVGVCLASILLLFICRGITSSTVYGFCTIWLYTPILFLTLVILIGKMMSKRFGRCLIVLDFMGEYSTEFWLLNSIFTSGIFWIQYICFLPKYSLMITVWAIIIMIPIAKFIRMTTYKICGSVVER